MARKDSLPTWLLLAAIIVALTTTGEGSNIAWRCHTCRPGYFVAQQCSTMFATRCARCPAGTYTDYFNTLFQCKPCSSCPYGHRKQVPCNREHDAKCILSTLLEHLHGTPGYLGDEPAKPDGPVTQPAIEDGSGEITEQKGSQFSNIFSDKNEGNNKFFGIPDLSKKLGESYQEELSGDSPIKPHLFDMNSFEAQIIKINKSVAKVSTEGPTLPTSRIPEYSTTTLLPDNEAHIDDLIPLQETKDGADLMTSTIDNVIEGSAVSTLTPEEHPETTTGIPIQPEMSDSDAPKSTPIQLGIVESDISKSTPIQLEVAESETPTSAAIQSEVESPLITEAPAILLPQIYDGRTNALVDSFSDIEGSIKQPVARFNLSAAVDPITAETTATVPTTEHVSTDGAEATILTQKEVTSTTGQLTTDPVVESEEADAETDNLELTETATAPSSTLAPDVGTNTDDAEAETTSAAPLKKMIVPFVEMMDGEAAAGNKTPVARIIPLEGADEDEPLQVTSVATEVERSSKDVETISSVEDFDALPVLTTPEQTYPMGNGSELLQEPVADTASTEGHKHMDIVIAVVITGIGLIVLAALAVRYFVKKRTFKDMRRSQDRIGIQTNEEDGLKRTDSQGDDGFQTAIYDDVELQTVNGGGKHFNGKANGHCKDVNVSSSSNNEILSAINCNYKPAITDKDAVSNGDVYTVPNKLAISEPAEPLLNGKPLTTESAETTTTPGFHGLAILDHLKYMDETTDEEAECIPTRLYMLRQTADDERYSEEDLLVNDGPNMNAIADEATPMLTRLSDCDS